ncbi:hypothetical protein [Stenotrophomonas sp. B1-1]|uniref:hypothetical protein n=1 Tax=Stenotrophomonas sp. B1-1 TaxID=2710648 RepID=UPI0013DC0CE4|nr:hypothetical protein [Stenotrophomonas sp. B1-1]
MTGIVVSIIAIGTRGEAAGKAFIAKPDSCGRYVLNRKRASSSDSPTNNAVNKVFATSLDQAADLLATNDYLINLVSADGKRALRQYSMVRIQRVGA